MLHLTLKGCSPSPLAHYLKAIGILRLVTEQIDPNARGRWENDAFVLETKLSFDKLVHFFTDEYAPSPIISPWNGGSGFHPKDGKTEIETIRNSETPRLSAYRAAIESAGYALQSLQITDKPDAKEKLALIRVLRNELPEEALLWLDSAITLSGEDTYYPPLLGSGGNDGRLDFSINFMRYILPLIFPENDIAHSELKAMVKTALNGQATAKLKGETIGQFMPANVKGTNLGSIDGTGIAVVNPMDFILTLEGSLLFQAAMTRRFGEQGKGVHVAPFTFRTANVGAGSLPGTGQENSRNEVWMPLWERSASLSEIQLLLSEGRVNTGKSPARDALDVVRAIGSLGVDRGITEFQRFGLLERNGLAFLATPLNRLKVKRRPKADLIVEIDSFIERLRYKASAATCPQSIKSATHRLEESVWKLASFGRQKDSEDTLLSLGHLEGILSDRLRWVTSEHLTCIPPLSMNWVSESMLVRPEARLALALASSTGKIKRSPSQSDSHYMAIHEHLVSLREGRFRTWRPEAEGKRNLTWKASQVPSSLIDTLERRLQLQNDRSDFPIHGRVSASLSDIASFIQGPFDDSLFETYLRAFCLLDWFNWSNSNINIPYPDHEESPFPDALYQLMKLCFAGQPVRTVEIPANPQILRLGKSGDGIRASLAAGRRLTGSIGRPNIQKVGVSGPHVTRTAAALIFPISKNSVSRLEGRLYSQPLLEEALPQ